MGTRATENAKATEPKAEYVIVHAPNTEESRTYFDMLGKTRYENEQLKSKKNAGILTKQVVDLSAELLAAQDRIIALQDRLLALRRIANAPTRDRPKALERKLKELRPVANAPMVECVRSTWEAAN